VEREIQVPESIKKTLERLHRDRTAVLALPPEKALKHILESPNPAALVHSFSEEDLYFLVHEIGPEDAIEILSLASNRQWDFFLDMEPWEKDRFTPAAVTRWVDLMLKADPHRLARWVFEEKTDFFEQYLFKNLEIRHREHDEDPSIFGEDFMTLDDVLYFRFIEYPFDPPMGPEEKKTRNHVLTELVSILARYDYPSYRNLMMKTAGVIPAESEEELYRLRNVRLREKGFLPYEEALGIYQSLSPESLKGRGGKWIPKRAEDMLLPVPAAFFRMFPEGGAFIRALRVLHTEAAALQIQTEFAALCNRIIAADQKAVHNREALGSVVRKACGYLNIGLERLNPEAGKADPNRSAAFLVRHPLADIFRVGFGAAQELKWITEKWQKTTWFSRQRLPMTFWGEEGLGVLGGLLIQRPLFFDHYETGVLYREFASLEDIEKTRAALEEIVAFDELFSFLRADVSSWISHPFFTYRNFLLTLWAGVRLGLVTPDADPAPVIPVPLGPFKLFFNGLWEGKKPSRRIRMTAKADFLNWLSSRSGFSEEDLRRKVGSGLESLFSRIESEYAKVSAKDLDARYIHLFLVQNPKAGPKENRHP